MPRGSSSGKRTFEEICALSDSSSSTTPPPKKIRTVVKIPKPARKKLSSSEPSLLQHSNASNDQGDRNSDAQTNVLQEGEPKVVHGQGPNSGERLGGSDSKPDPSDAVSESANLGTAIGSAALVSQGRGNTEGKQNEGIKDFQPQKVTQTVDDDDYPHLIQLPQDDSMVLLAHTNGVREHRHRIWAKLIKKPGFISGSYHWLSIYLYQKIGDQHGAQQAAFVEDGELKDNYLDTIRVPMSTVKVSWLTPYFGNIARSRGFPETKIDKFEKWCDFTLHAIVAVLSCFNPRLRTDCENDNPVKSRGGIDWSSYKNEKTCRPRCLRVPASKNALLEATNDTNVTNAVDNASHRGGVLGSLDPARHGSKDRKEAPAPHEGDESTDDEARTIRPNSPSVREAENEPSLKADKSLSTIPTGSMSTKTSLSQVTRITEAAKASQTAIQSEATRLMEAVKASEIAKAREICLDHSLQYVKAAEGKVEAAERQQEKVEQELKRQRERVDSGLKKTENSVRNARRKSQKAGRDLKTAESWIKEVKYKNQMAEQELKRVESKAKDTQVEKQKVEEDFARQKRTVDRTLENAEANLKEAREADNQLKRSYGDMTSG